MFLVNDYGRLSVARILAGAVLTGLLVGFGIRFFDERIFLMLRRLDGNFWEIFTMFGAAKFILFLSFAIFLFKIWSTGIFNKKTGDIAKVVVSGQSVWLTVSAGVFTSVLSATGLVFALRILIGRLRPVFFESIGASGFFPLSIEHQFHSMPSSGASASFAALVLLGLFFPGIKRYTWALAILFALSRVIVGAHFPSDVILGAFIGMLIADVTYISFKRASGN